MLILTVFLLTTIVILTLILFSSRQEDITTVEVEAESPEEFNYFFVTVKYENGDEEVIYVAETDTRFDISTGDSDEFK
jgi:hypothetical protein